ncbi:hypothetical protein, partial [Paraburkholderia aspalathi]|uniref:hypothetical protein n=1 Tax=Paraburkholderia aspalathi TaxID=1324617 RepID=UPI001ABFDE0C
SRTSLHCMPSPTLPDWYINTQTTDHHAVEIFDPDHCGMISRSMTSSLVRFDVQRLIARNLGLARTVERGGRPCAKQSAGARIAVGLECPCVFPVA